MKKPSRFKETLGGKTPDRVLLNEEVAGKRLSGKVIDLGTKDGTSSYIRVMDTSSCQLVFSDFFSASENVLKLDLETKLPIQTGTYDAVLLFNTLEHIFEYAQLLKECHRIVRVGGEFAGYVPFLCKYHEDPSDYHRFTHVAIKRHLRNAGFSEPVVRTVGTGVCLNTANLLARGCRFGIVRFGLWLMASAGDWVLDRIWKRNRDFYCGVYFEARKQSN